MPKLNFNPDSDCYFVIDQKLKDTLNKLRAEKPGVVKIGDDKLIIGEKILIKDLLDKGLFKIFKALVKEELDQIEKLIKKEYYGKKTI